MEAVSFVPYDPKQLQCLKVHKSDVSCVDLFGQTHLVTSSTDKLIRFWRWTTTLGFVEEEFSPGKGHKYGVIKVLFSPQGTMVASCSIDGTTRVWRSKDGVQSHQLLQPNGHGVRTCKFTADSAHLLTGADDGSVCIWSILQKSLVRIVRGHEGAVQALTVCAEGAILFTTCTLGVVNLYSLQDMTDSDQSVRVNPLASLDDAHDLGVLCADASMVAQDCDELIGWRSCQVITGGQDQKVKLWQCLWQNGGNINRSIGKQTTRGQICFVKQMEGHTSAVTDVKWCNTSGSRTIASCSVDKTVRLWSSDGRCFRVLGAHNRYINTVAFSVDGSLLVTGSNDKTVKVWSLRVGVDLETEFQAPCSLLSHFGAGDLEGIGPAELTLSELANARGDIIKLCSDTETHSGAINSLCFYGDYLLATASSDRMVRLFRWSELECALENETETPLSGHKYPVTAVDFTAFGDMLLSCSLDGSAVMWDPVTGARLRTLSVECAGMVGARSVEGAAGAGGGGARGARAGAGGAVLVACDDHVAPIWYLKDECADPVHVYTGHTDTVTCCAISPSGNLVVTGSADGDFRVYCTPNDLHEPLHLKRQIAHDLGVQSCDFSSNPELVTSDTNALVIATSGCDSLGKIWIIQGLEEPSAVECKLVKTLFGHGGNVTCIRFSSAGDLVATTATDKQARVWCVSSGRCVQIVTFESGAACCSISTSRILAVGCLDGELSLWRLPLPSVYEMSEDVDTALRGPLSQWSQQDVATWLVENVIRAPELLGATELSDELKELLYSVKEHGIDGAKISAMDIDELLEEFGRDLTSESNLTKLLAEELQWLKKRELGPEFLFDNAIETKEVMEPPHHMLCPVTHRLMRDPVKCADGFTYERAAILECFLSSGKLVSPMSNQPLLNAELTPNYELKKAIRQFLIDGNV